jgi:molybdopterin-containing oxidoreductase family iron-sulfur binding subunit
MTLTGMNADHRLRVPTSQVVAVAAAIAAKIAPQNGQIKALADKLPLPASVNAEWITECAADLSANRGASIVLAGHRQPPAVHVVATLLNTALGNHGKTVFFSELVQSRITTDIAGLVGSLMGGQIDTLVILGGNPAYNAPSDLNCRALPGEGNHPLGFTRTKPVPRRCATQRAFVLRSHTISILGRRPTSDGTFVPVQPLIAPISTGLTELSALAPGGFA